MIVIFSGILLIFLLVLWFCGSPFLLWLVKFYSHGGDRLLARLAAHDIQFLDSEELLKMMPPHRGNQDLTASCWSPEESWGGFVMSWDPSWIENRKQFLLTSKETQEIRYLNPDLFVAIWKADKREFPRLFRHYFMTGEGWAIEWHLVEEDGHPRTRRVEELITGITGEEREIPYHWRLKYYRSMVLEDRRWLEAFGTHHPGPFWFISSLYIIPKTAVLGLCSYLFAYFPAADLQKIVPYWHAAILIPALSAFITLNLTLKRMLDS